MVQDGVDAGEKFPFLAGEDHGIIESMKIKAGLAIASMALTSLSLAQEKKAEVGEHILKLSPGDRWEYLVTVQAPKGAKMPEAEGVTVKEVPDGIQSQFTKVRIYEGKKQIKPEGESLDTFRMERNGKAEELEFSDVRSGAIYARGWKKEGDKPGEVFLLTKPLLMVASTNEAGHQWEIKAGDGRTTPVFNRKFRVFGHEKVSVPAGEFEAIRVEVTGASGMTEIKRTYWFAEGVGFVKEEKTYYSKTTRLIHQVMELAKYTPQK